MPAQRQLPTALTPHPNRAATADVPPSASMTSLVDWRKSISVSELGKWNGKYAGAICHKTSYKNRL
jgi:hypothetical protein